MGAGTHLTEQAPARRSVPRWARVAVQGMIALAWTLHGDGAAAQHRPHREHRRHREHRPHRGHGHHRHDRGDMILLSPGAPSCVPGALSVCACPDGTSGTMACSSAGVPAGGCACLMSPPTGLAAQTVASVQGGASIGVAPAATGELAFSERSGGGVRVGGYVTLGLGAVTLALAGVASWQAQSEFDRLQVACSVGDCGAHADLDAGRQMTLLANIGWVAGGVLVAAAIPMIALGGPSRRAARVEAVRLMPVVVPGGVGVVGVF